MLKNFDVQKLAMALRKELVKAARDNTELSLSEEDIDLTVKAFQASATFVKTLLVETNIGLLHRSSARSKLNHFWPVFMITPLRQKTRIL